MSQASAPRSRRLRVRRKQPELPDQEIPEQAAKRRSCRPPRALDGDRDLYDPDHRSDAWEDDLYDPEHGGDAAMRQKSHGEDNFYDPEHGGDAAMKSHGEDNLHDPEHGRDAAMKSHACAHDGQLEVLGVDGHIPVNFESPGYDQSHALGGPVDTDALQNPSKFFLPSLPAQMIREVPT